MYSSMLKSDGDIIITQAKISDTFFSNVDINLIEKIKQTIKYKRIHLQLLLVASPVENFQLLLFME